MKNTVYRQDVIDTVSHSIEFCNKALDSTTLGGRDRYAVEVERNSLLKLKDDFKCLPSAQPEEDKLKKIADVLSEKMSYMNMCPNERDIILGYLGVKRSNTNHCNTDCWNEKCESYHYETRKQKEPCDLCPNLEKGDTLYQSSDWDGGIGFDYIWDIQYCPKCGRRLKG